MRLQISHKHSSDALRHGGVRSLSRRRRCKTWGWPLLCGCHQSLETEQRSFGDDSPPARTNRVTDTSDLELPSSLRPASE